MSNAPNLSTDKRLANPGQLTSVYVLLFIAAILIFFLIRFYGEGLTSLPVAETAAATSAAASAAPSKPCANAAAKY